MEHSERHSTLKKLARRHGDMIVSRYNSLQAGNCVEGTDEFIGENFAGRTAVTIDELIPFVDTREEVRSLLIWKLRSKKVLSEAEDNEIGE
jgi:hypothetical protein